MLINLLKSSVNNSSKLHEILENFVEIVPVAKGIKTVYVVCSKFRVLQFEENCRCFVRCLVADRERLDTFINRLTEKERQWLENFIMENLLNEDETEKSKVLAFLFNDLCLTKDKDLFLRLMKCIQNCFTKDLQVLPKYKETASVNWESDHFLSRADLIEEIRPNESEFVDPLENYEKSYKLTPLGVKLVEILTKHNWFDEPYSA